MQTASPMSLSSHSALQKQTLQFLNDALYGQRTMKDTPMISVPFPFECVGKEAPSFTCPKVSLLALVHVHKFHPRGSFLNGEIRRRKKACELSPSVFLLEASCPQGARPFLRSKFRPLTITQDKVSLLNIEFSVLGSSLAYRCKPHSPIQLYQ